jgi:hypothetical protein
MARPNIPDEMVERVENIHTKLLGYRPSSFQEALGTVSTFAKQSIDHGESEKREGEHIDTSKSARDMYSELGHVQEKGTVYVLQRSTPYRVEFIEQESRNDGGDLRVVWLTGPSGGEYRLVADCEEDRFIMEDNSQGEWRTHSTKCSGFRYRSPNHPKAGKKWDYVE